MSHKALLSPMDQFMPSRHVRVVLAFSSSNPEAAIVALNRGLCMTCTQIPYLKGNIYQSDQRGYLGVAWSGDDAPGQLHETSAPDNVPTYAELDAQGMPDRYISRSLFPPLFEDTPGLSVGLPVLRVSCTVIRGGFFVCIHFHHNVMDGAGVADLLNIWATNTRSDASDASPEVLDDLAQRNSQLEKALTSNHKPASGPNSASPITKPPSSIPGTGASAVSSAGSVPPSTEIVSPPVTSSLFTLEASKLDSLSKVLASTTSGKVITKNTIISALVWTRVSLIRSRRRQRQQSQPSNTNLATIPNSSIIMTVNLRKYVFNQPEPQQLFLGNLLSTLPTPISIPDSTTLSDLTTSPTTQIRYPTILPHAASSLTASYANLSSQLASRMYSLASNMPDVRTFRKARAPFNGTDLVVTSWMNFAFYPDFGPGVGAPAYVRLPDVGADADGLLVVLPRKRGEGGEGDIEIMVALREDDMRELEEDEVFGGFAKRVAPS